MWLKRVPLGRKVTQVLVPSAGDLPTQPIWKGLATAGQYVVPLPLTAGALAD